ncbi:hypothetical protein V0U79_13570 [Hyphobacterium sp. HN65]|uniref:DUF1376 domain-containing protein n=1 Tax=Hyphobacterium lacteum TaxID=3116575 RepID=A0ABU7LTY4_9PROT|nr:hypothetical protein [Hyphobacterium sp. HN65]MEE2527390.1 hypothetical protein [Hyphobacterium sp. HN65]
MSDLPWFKFNAADWLSQPIYRRLTLEERGVLIDLWSLASQGEPRGHLTSGGSPIIGDDLCHLMRINQDTLLPLLAELEKRGHLARKNGIWKCPTIIKEEARRQKYIKNGRLGGNPSLLKRTKNPTSLNPEKDQDTDTEIKKKKEKTSERERQPIGDDWFPSDSAIKYAVNKLPPGTDIADTVEAFISHAQAKGTTYDNPNAGFRRWVQKAEQFDY